MRKISDLSSLESRLTIDWDKIPLIIVSTVIGDRRGRVRAYYCRLRGIQDFD